MNDKNFYIIKAMVVLMGATLIFGVVFLIVLIYQRNAKTATVNPQSVASLSGDCEGGELNLPEKGVIDQASLNGNVLMVIMSQSGEDAGQKLLVIDYCKNKVINQVNLSK